MRALLAAALVGMTLGAGMPAAPLPPASQPFLLQRPQPVRTAGSSRYVPPPTTAPGQSPRRQRRLARHGKTV